MNRIIYSPALRWAFLISVVLQTLGTPHLYAQVQNVNAYLNGSYIELLPGACGNAPDYAAQLLDYCDEEGNLYIVRNSTRLMSDGVTDVFDNYFDAGAAYRTTEGISVVPSRGGIQNIPYAALNYRDADARFRQNDARTGLITAAGELLLTSGGFDPVIHGYDLQTRELRVIEAAFPATMAYDVARGGTWLLQVGIAGTSLSFLADGAAAPTTPVSFQASRAIGPLDAVVMGDRLLVASAATGLISIDLAAATPQVVTYDASNSGDLPSDNLFALSVDPDAANVVWLATGSLGRGAAVVRADLGTGTFVPYTLQREDGSGPEWFTDVAIGPGGERYATSATYAGLLRLSLDGAGVGTWTRIPLSQLSIQDPLAEISEGLRAGPTVVEHLGNGRFAVAVDPDTPDDDTAIGQEELALFGNNTVRGFYDDDNGALAANNRQRGLATPAGDIWWTTTSGGPTLLRARSGSFFFVDGPRVRREAATDGSGALIGFDYEADAASAFQPFGRPLVIPGASEGLEAFAPFGDEVWGLDPSSGFGDTTVLEAFSGGGLVGRFPIDVTRVDYSTASDFAILDGGTALAVTPINGDGVRAYFLDPAAKTTTTVTFAGVGEVRRVLPEPGGGAWIVGTVGQLLIRGGVIVRQLDLAQGGNTRSLQDATLDENGTLYVTRDRGGIELMRVPLAGGAAEPTIEVIDLKGVLDEFQPRSRGLTLDANGGLWLVAQVGFLRLNLANPIPVYRPAGDRAVVQGVVYVDYNDNGSYDRGTLDASLVVLGFPYVAPEGLAGIPVRLLDDQSRVVGLGISDREGRYRISIPRPTADVTYAVATPDTLDGLVITQTSSPEVSLAAGVGSVVGPDLRYVNGAGGSLAVRVVTRSGLWGFDREGFGNIFTVIASNLSAREDLANVELELTYYYASASPGALPPSIIDPVVTTRLVPRENYRSAYGLISVDPVSGRLSGGDLLYNYQLAAGSFSASAAGTDTITVRLPIGDLAARETIVFEVETETWDPTTFDEEVYYGVSSASAASFSGGNGDGGKAYRGDPFLDPDAPTGRRGAPGVIIPSRRGGSGGGMGTGEVTYEPTPRGRVRSSYDPNDKLVDGGAPCAEDVCTTPAPLAERELAYTIRFENQGNFSAFDVVLLDTLDQALDPASVRLLSSSDAVDLSVLGGPGSASEAGTPVVLRFDFAGIDLGFEDAVNDGFVRFAVRLREPATEGLSVSNRASIYFDQNPPIRTNAVVRTFVNVVGVREAPMPSLGLFPNPARDRVTLSAATEVASVTVTDLLGRQLPVALDGGSLDLRGWPAGVYVILARLVDGEVAQGRVVVK